MRRTGHTALATTFRSTNSSACAALRAWPACEHHGDACPGSTVRIAWPQLEAFQQSLLAKNYRYAKPGLERMPWGMLEMRIADPFGNHLVFFEELPDTPKVAGS